MNDIIDVIREEIKDPVLRQCLYKSVIKALEGADWDTQDECLDRDPAFDAVIAELYH